MAISSNEVITNPYRIISLLQRACTTHATISLQRPHERFIYNSMILTLDPDAQYFTIDDPIGSQLPLKAKTGEWLKFKIKLQGLTLTFEANIKDKLTNDSLSGYQIHLPLQVNYQQRRGAFRASIGYQFNASLTAMMENNQPVRGRMVDLSLRGASIEIQAPLPPDLKHQTPLTKCQLQSAGDTIYISSAIVRTIQISEQSLDLYRLGVEFLNLLPGERRNLQRWVMKYDRENRKSALS